MLCLLWSPSICYNLSQSDVERQLKATFCMMYIRFKIKCRNVTPGGHTFQLIDFNNICKMKRFVTIGPLISPVNRTGLVMDWISQCREVWVGTHRDGWVGTHRDGWVGTHRDGWVGDQGVWRDRSPRRASTCHGLSSCAFQPFSPISLFWQDLGENNVASSPSRCDWNSLWPSSLPCWQPSLIYEEPTHADHLR